MSCAPDEQVAEAYRAEVRSFIARSKPPTLRHEGVRSPADEAEESAIRAWLRALYTEGHLGAGWPVEHGGRPNHPPRHDLILMEELIRAGAYRPLDQVMLASHAIIRFGTPRQQAELLPRIRSGADIWCQLFSEPDAGSDLAGLRTRARRVSGADGGGFVVSGQKVWSTDAQWADRGLLLARTDPSVERHAGLTVFVVPMDLPGITVRPIREMTGFAEFCEVFLDEVRVGPEHVLGDVDDGWSVITSGLASERAFVGANAVLLDRLFDDLVTVAGAARLPDGTVALDHEDVRHRLALALVELEQAKLVVRDTVDRIVLDAEHPSDGPVAKLAYTELNVELCELALGLLGSAVSVDEAGHDAAERCRSSFLWSRALTISGGASEVLRGLIGRQLLGLPRT
jgi:alkylation response protein AidB-like acyl-CoA dehydrogenase